MGLGVRGLGFRVKLSAIPVVTAFNPRTNGKIDDFYCYQYWDFMAGLGILGYTARGLVCKFRA